MRLCGTSFLVSLHFLRHLLSNYIQRKEQNGAFSKVSDAHSLSELLQGIRGKRERYDDVGRGEGGGLGLSEVLKAMPCSFFILCMCLRKHDFSNNFVFRPGGTQVAALTFGTDVEIHFNLGDFENNAMEKAKRKIKKINQPGGGTATRAALDTVRNVIAPMTRKSAQKVLFFITDGHSNIGGSPEKAAKKLRKQYDFQIYAIGVGKKPKLRELRSIASVPANEDEEYVISVKNFKDFEKAIEKAKVIKIGMY